MHGGVDHLDGRLRGYRVFLNPSTSDVVATTSAEALAMGKWLLCPAHASNAFFAGFANCLVYRSPAEFARQLRVAEARGGPAKEMVREIPHLSESAFVLVCTSHSTESACP